MGIALGVSVNDDAALVAFKNVLYFDSLVLGNDFRNERRAKTALTSAHTGAYSSLYAVYGCDFEGAFERVDDLALAHFFAAANNLAVFGIFCDILRSFLVGKICKPRSVLVNGIEIRLFFQLSNPLLIQFLMSTAMREQR